MNTTSTQNSNNTTTPSTSSVEGRSHHLVMNEQQMAYILCAIQKAKDSGMPEIQDDLGNNVSDIIEGSLTDIITCKRYDILLNKKVEFSYNPEDIHNLTL